MRAGATLAKEIERVGIPTAHVCAIVPVAQVVGSNRIIHAHKIVSPVGNADLEKEAEREFRRAIIDKALKALSADVK